MADYADLPTVKAILFPQGHDDTNEDARLADLNAVVSRQLEDRAGLLAGETFGVDGVPLTRTFQPFCPTEVLTLWPPVRTVTSVSEDGTDLVGGTDYHLVYHLGAYWGGLYRMGDPLGWAAVNRDPRLGPGWAGTVQVTGSWADQGAAPLDPVVVEAANVLVAGLWRKDQTADGTTGGSSETEGFTQGDPWADPRVKHFLAVYASWQDMAAPARERAGTRAVAG